MHLSVFHLRNFIQLVLGVLACRRKEYPYTPSHLFIYLRYLAWAFGICKQFLFKLLYSKPYTNDQNHQIFHGTRNDWKRDKLLKSAPYFDVSFQQDSFLNGSLGVSLNNAILSWDFLWHHKPAANDVYEFHTIFYMITVYIKCEQC